MLIMYFTCMRGDDARRMKWSFLRAPLVHEIIGPAAFLVFMIIEIGGKCAEVNSIQDAVALGIQYVSVNLVSVLI